MTLLHYGAGVLLGQASKYVGKKLLVEGDTYERITGTLEAIDTELKTYEGMDLSKPATVLQGVARLLKSRVKPKPTKAFSLLTEQQSWAIYEEIMRKAEEATGRSWCFFHKVPDEAEAERIARAIVPKIALDQDWLMDGNDSLFAHAGAQHHFQPGCLVLTVDECKGITGRRDVFAIATWEIPGWAVFENDPSAAHLLPTKETCSVAYARIKIMRLKKKAPGFDLSDPMSYPGAVRAQDSPFGAYTSRNEVDDTVETHEEDIIWTVDTFREEGGSIANQLLAENVWRKFDNTMVLSDIINTKRTAGGSSSTGPSPQFLFDSLDNRGSQPFVGPERALFEQWRKFLDSREPVTILLDGPPGCGKTTLILDLIRSWPDKRVMSISHDKVEALCREGWSLTRLGALYHADIIWIDDVDRLEIAWLNIMLAKLDRASCNAPLVILTTNHLARLPPALYRAGRVDYIYRISNRPESRRELIRSLMTNLGIDESMMLEEHWAQLMFMSETRSGAYIAKYLRRGKVMGDMNQMFDPFDADVNVTEDTK